MTEENKKALAVVDGETLMDMHLPSTRFCVETLLPQGITILGGAPKIGKSWLVLDLCVRVAKGEKLWGLPTRRGTTLYLCLEDTLRRVQGRLNRMTDEAPPNAFFATAAGNLAEELCRQLRGFVAEHPDTVLIAIDTFQMVRSPGVDATYASDYEEVRKLKELADELGIALLLVHHLRKQGDSDPLNKLSGTTGISGAVDAVFILDQSRRNAGAAAMICTGRDIEYRELELRFSREEYVWERLSDSLEEPALALPREMASLVEFMRGERSYYGTNSEFTERFNAYSGCALTPKTLKQTMNRWRYALEDRRVFFHSRRSNGQRLLEVFFSPAFSSTGAASAESAAGAPGHDPSVPCGTDSPGSPPRRRGVYVTSVREE